MMVTMPFLMRFLSTPSARRATSRQNPKSAKLRISIHALREEGDVQPIPAPPRRDISIHALREEGDHCNFRLSEQMM